MKRSLVLALLSASLFAACGEGSLDVATHSVAGEPLDDGEVFYLDHAFGVVALESSAPFEHIEFHVSLADAELRALDDNGSVIADWAHVESFVEDDDPVAHEGIVNLPAAASTVELRMYSEVEFARIAVGPGHSGGHEGEVELADGAVSVLRAHPGRWTPPAHIVAAGNQQYLPYTGAPGRCAGTMLPGARSLAHHLIATFPGAVSYGGYNCRRNSANSSQLSVHASGRAVDLFVPLSGGQADNDLGDPIAHYLIQNANRLGIEFIVWDRSSWGAHRAAPKHRAYGGPHPHHDHLHIELAPWAAHGQPAFDRSPRGYLDAANCGGINGWSQDPDAPHQAVEVYVSIGGPVFTPGAHGAWIVADEHRQDLCGALGSCNHGWYTKVPHGLMDNVARTVYAYGADRTGGQSAQLVGVKTLRCGPPSLPYTPATAVRRHIPNPAAFEAWGFDWNDIIRVNDSVLNSFAVAAKLPAQPTLRNDGGAIFVVEGQTKRHVPNPRAMNAWGLDWGAVRPMNTGGLTQKRKLEQRPYIIRGSQPGAYLLWPK